MYAFLMRVLPKHTEQIVYEFINSDNGNDVFEIDWKDEKLVIRGNNKIAVAAALGYYLKHIADVNISWCGCNLNLPGRLPQAKKYRHIIEQKYRVYMNYCTFNYSASWWILTVGRKKLILWH